jgi:hypothetical protein
MGPFAIKTYFVTFAKALAKLEKLSDLQNFCKVKSYNFFFLLFIFNE